MENDFLRWQPSLAPWLDFLRNLGEISPRRLFHQAQAIIDHVFKTSRAKPIYCLRTLPGTRTEIMRGFWHCSRLLSDNPAILELSSHS
jgi:hypothetical protein